MYYSIVILAILYYLRVADLIGITSPYPRENIIAGNYILADMQAYLDKRHRQQNKEILIRHSPMVDGKSGFLYFDKNGSICYSLHWEHYFQHIIQKYNNTYKVQMPVITPHVCRHTYCSNMAKARMNPKTLQYLMGHSDISVTMNVYTHIGFDDAEEELKRMEEFRKAQAEVEQKKEKPMLQKMFKAI